MARIELDMDYLYYLYVAAAIVLVVALISTTVWWLSIERLPGYDMLPVKRSSFVEPSGKVSEYFTGKVEEIEYSIIGPKMMVQLDSTGSGRTFYLPVDAPVWLGLIFEDKDISGKERTTFKEIKRGQRVAVFIGSNNRATRVNIIKR